MSNFDTEVRPILHSIQHAAMVTATHADRVARDVADLPARPAWVTKAEAELEAAELAIVAALRNVRAAREHYRKVKVEAV